MIDGHLIGAVFLPVLFDLGATLFILALCLVAWRATRSSRCQYSDPACGPGRRCYRCWADGEW